MIFENFARAEFPQSTVDIRNFPGPPDGYIYVLFWAQNGSEIPFYVGQTKRLFGDN
jgi:hypothetical protein